MIFKICMRNFNYFARSSNLVALFQKLGQLTKNNQEKATFMAPLFENGIFPFINSPENISLESSFRKLFRNTSFRHLRGIAKTLS